MLRKKSLLGFLVLMVLPFAAQAQSVGGCTMSYFSYYPWTGNAAWVQMICPETGWFVVVQNSQRGLQVGPAFLLRSQGSVIRVLDRANAEEIYTVYHPGTPRISDTQFCTAATCIDALDANDLGPNATLIPTHDRAVPTIAAEIRDRGVAWMCKSPGRSHTRRGVEMKIWGVWDPGNYDYIVEYTFRDDGQISFRAGATGWNNTTVQPLGAAEPHMHDIVWRVDMNLGVGHNSALTWSHIETGLSSIDMEVPFNNGVEGSMDLDPLHFASLIIEDQMQNAVGNNIGYELLPFHAGTARHFGFKEGWSQHDTWVTHYSSAEEAIAVPPTAAWSPVDDYLLGDSTNHYGVQNQEPITNTHLVIWHVSSAHHDPHDEDQAKGHVLHEGLTLVHWSGFDLVPHNLFDANPLGGPARDICDGPPLCTNCN